MSKEEIKIIGFEEAIKTYLDNYAEENEFFKTKYSNVEKTIKGCVKFIYDIAKKHATNNVCGISDDQVYYLARHYFEEEDINFEVKEIEVPKVEHTKETKTETTNPVKSKAKENNKPKEYDQINIFELL